MFFNEMRAISYNSGITGGYILGFMNVCPGFVIGAASELFSVAHSHSRYNSKTNIGLEIEVEHLIGL